MSENLCRLLDQFNASMSVPKNDEQITDLLVEEYDRLLAEREHRAKEVRSMPLRMYRKMPVWMHMSRVLLTAKALGADPQTFLRAQFAALEGSVAPWQTYGPAAAKRYMVWKDKQRCKYRGDADRAEQVQNMDSDVSASLSATLTSGLSMWRAMGRPNPIAVATAAPNMLPPMFLLAFKVVEAATRKGIVVATVLREALGVLDADESLWSVIRVWRENNTGEMAY